jgi:hypothetical protein
MNKRIILILLAVAVVIGAVAGGITYAQMEHQAMKGSKLVGTAWLGTKARDTGNITFVWTGTFGINNPDCVNDINIERLSIIKDDGSVVYEGDLLQCGEDVNDPRQPVTILQPHEQLFIPLDWWMPDGAGGWLTADEASSQDMRGYTVEILWSGERKGLEISGYVESTQITFFHDPQGGVVDVDVSSSRIQMQNLIQR